MYCVGVWDSQFTQQFFFRLLPKSLKCNSSYNDRLTDHLIAEPFCGNPVPQLAEIQTVLRDTRMVILHRRLNIDFNISYLTSTSRGLFINTKQKFPRWGPGREGGEAARESGAEPEPSTKSPRILF